MSDMVHIRNGQALSLQDVPNLNQYDFREAVIGKVRSGSRISALFGMPDDDSIMLFAILTDDHLGIMNLCRTTVKNIYPSLTADIPQAHWFERELAEQWGLLPDSHPWLKPIRFHNSYRDGHNVWDDTGKMVIEPGVTNYFEVSGDEIHEVAVGPVHAGIIEPGHFRFQCHGENVFHLEIELGYQHRGIERALVGGPDHRTRHYMETAAGDTTVGHTIAYSLVREALNGVFPPPRAQAIRAIALELERMANHTGDLGALAGDIGFLPTSSFCGRIRGDFLNITAMLCGNRFGRNLICPGGLNQDFDSAVMGEFIHHLNESYKDVKDAVDLLWDTPSVLSRFEDTGIVTEEDATRLGLVGPAARARGVKRDIRSDLPWGAYRVHNVPAVAWNTGDIHARARVRMLELQHSYQFILEELDGLSQGPILSETNTPAPDRIAVALVEGWRGEICHAAVTDADGRFRRYKIVDPSFHNWAGLAISLRDQQISDFPLCNKSFNLSYCGHDL